MENIYSRRKINLRVIKKNYGAPEKNFVDIEVPANCTGFVQLLYVVGMNIIKTSIKESMKEFNKQQVKTKKKGEKSIGIRKQQLIQISINAVAMVDVNSISLGYRSCALGKLEEGNQVRFVERLNRKLSLKVKKRSLCGGRKKYIKNKRLNEIDVELSKRREIEEEKKESHNDVEKVEYVKDLISNRRFLCFFEEKEIEKIKSVEFFFRLHSPTFFPFAFLF